MATGFYKCRAEKVASNTMNEKTESLRNLFLDVTDEETVTERQKESPGSLTSDERADERLADLISRMRDRYEFETDCLDAELARIADGFYEHQSDETIAEELDIDPEDVFRARLDLHLVSERDREGPIDFGALRRRLVEEPTTEALRAEFDVSESELDRFRRVAASDNEARRANHRYRDQFEEILNDGDLSSPLTRAAKEDGLEDATEGLESNVSF